MTEIAKGIQTHPQFKLGSILGSGLKDERTVKLESVLDTTTQAPASWDFDKGRKAFPTNVWGNNDYGDCELAGRANYLLRLQRAQTKTTPAISDDDVIALYKLLTGCVSPGDANDTGLSTLDNLGAWRKGWDITKDWQIGGQQTRDYQISAYGFIDPANAALLRLCSYLFSGALLGCNMPLTAQAQTNNKVWDVDSSAGSDADPGSWGGHCVYTKRYDADNIYVLTWGMEVRVTNAWINMYCDEAYSVVDSFDTWFKFPHVLDVQKLINEMQQAGIQVQQ